MLPTVQIGCAVVCWAIINNIAQPVLKFLWLTARSYVVLLGERFYVLRQNLFSPYTPTWTNAFHQMKYILKANNRPGTSSPYSHLRLRNLYLAYNALPSSRPCLHIRKQIPVYPC